MRRSFWFRLVAGWLACWLPLVLADGGRLHMCPMHDGVAMAPPGVTAAAGPGAGMPPMAEDVSHPASALGGRAARGAHEHGGHTAGHACTCLGACCATLAVVPVRPPLMILATMERASAASTGRPEHEYVAAWVDFVLPFATAPPTRG